MKQHGGAREGAGRPRADVDGKERRKHSLYCTRDELAAARSFLRRLRTQSEDGEPQPEYYVYEMGDSVASFREWDSGEKLAKLNKLIKKNARRTVELHFEHVGARDIVLTLYNVASVDDSIFDDSWAFFDGNNNGVATVDMNDVSALRYVYKPDDRLFVYLRALVL